MLRMLYSHDTQCNLLWSDVVHTFFKANLHDIFDQNHELQYVNERVILCFISYCKKHPVSLKEKNFTLSRKLI